MTQYNFYFSKKQLEYRIQNSGKGKYIHKYFLGMEFTEATVIGVSMSDKWDDMELLGTGNFKEDVTYSK